MFYAIFMRKLQDGAKFIFYINNKWLENSTCTLALIVENSYQFIEVYLTILNIPHLLKIDSKYLTSIYKFFIPKKDWLQFIAIFRQDGHHARRRC
jgi:hypothetical protein